MQALLFEYWSFKFACPYLNRSKQAQIGHTWSKLVKSVQRMVKLHMKWVQRNIWIYLDAQELNECIYKYIQMLKNLSNK